MSTEIQKDNRVYRMKLRPTEKQEALLWKQSSARRFVWNWGLAFWRDKYKATGKGSNFVELCKEMVHLKKQETWLMEVHDTPLQQTLKDLCGAFQKFFRKQGGYPKFKSAKKSMPSFRHTRSVKLVSNGDKVHIPKLGDIEVVNSWKGKIPEDLRSCTFSRTPTKEWFLSAVVEWTPTPVPEDQLDTENSVGIDLGCKDALVLSTGQKIRGPKAFRRYQKNMARLQRSQARKKKGSRRYKAQKATIANLHKKIHDVRQDFVNKVTTQVVKKFDIICMETLSVKGMARTKLAKSVLDGALGDIRRQVEYKAKWAGKKFVQADRWFPSSKLHWRCGYLNEDLKLSDREWVCPCTGEVLDRDVNAAENIEQEGRSMLALGLRESLNARRLDVRLLETEAIWDEAIERGRGRRPRASSGIPGL